MKQDVHATNLHAVLGTESGAAATGQIYLTARFLRGISHKIEISELANDATDVSAEISLEEGSDAGVMQLHLGDRTQGHSLAKLPLKLLRKTA